MRYILRLAKLGVIVRLLLAQPGVLVAVRCTYAYRA